MLLYVLQCVPKTSTNRLQGISNVLDALCIPLVKKGLQIVPATADSIITPKVPTTLAAIKCPKSPS